MSAPIPARPGPPPPPPNRAQELVAKAGVTVFEPGRSLLDQPVLVYVARPGKEWPDFEIFDHVGRPFGSVRQTSPRTWFSSAGHVNRFSVYDSNGNPILNLEQGSHGVNSRFTVQGILEAQLTREVWRSQLSMKISGQDVGLVTGQRLSGLTGMKLKVEDHRSLAVAELFGYREHSHLLNFIPSYVVSVDPGLKGPLRYLIPALAPVVTITRRQQQNG